MSPQQTNRKENEDSKLKFQNKMNTSSAMMLMNNLNSFTLDTSKKSSKSGPGNKKNSFINSIEETGEPPDTSSMTINPKVMEVWLNDILQEAKDLGLKSCFLKNDKKKPINQYGIDRQSLLKHGLNSTLVNRVYRGLFVYSVGFFELLKKLAVESNSRTHLMATIWRVYAILLEFCCKTDYELMISEITRLSQQENIELRSKLEQLQIEFFEKEAKIIEKCDELKSRTEAAEKKTDMYVIHIEKLNEYIEDLRRRNEEEINIRKQFEAKLNELHSVGRDHDVKYYRALEEIDEYMQKFEFVDKELKRFEGETIELSKEKVMLETNLINLENKCSLLSNENISLNRVLRQKDTRIFQLDEDCQNTKKKLASTIKQLKDTSLKLSIDQMKTQKLAEDLDELTQKYDKKSAQAKTYEDRIESLETQIDQARKDKQKFERDFHTIKGRQEEYTSKNIDLLDKVDKVTEDHSALRDKYEVLQGKSAHQDQIYEELSKNYKALTRTLKKVNSERKKLYEDAVRSERLATEFEKDLASSNEKLELEKVNYNKIKARFSQLELEFENAEIIKNKELRKIEIEKDVAEDKLKNAIELRVRHNHEKIGWVKRYEEEYQTHIKTLSLLNDSKVKIKDLEAERNRLASDIKELDKSHKIALKLSKEKEVKYNEAIKENEKLRIKGQSSADTIDNMADNHREYITRLKKEHRKIMAERDSWYNRASMEHEDVFMRAAKFYEENKENNRILQSFKGHLKLYKDKLRRTNEELEGYKKKHNVINAHMDQLYKENESLKSEVKIKNDQIIQISEKRLELYLEKEGIKGELQVVKGREIIQKLACSRASETSMSHRKNSLETNTEAFEGNSDFTEEIDEHNKKLQTDFCVMKSKAVQTKFETTKSKFYAANAVSQNRFSSKTLRYQNSTTPRSILDEFSVTSSEKEVKERLLEKERTAMWSSGGPSAKPRASAIANVVFQENNFLNDHSSSKSILPALKKTNKSSKTSRNTMFSYPKSPGQKSVDKLKQKPQGKLSSKDLTSGGKTSLKDEQNKLKSIYGNNKLLKIEAKSCENHCKSPEPHSKLLPKKIQKEESLDESKKRIKGMIKSAIVRD
ncbi:unnamed protein product [Moneuplotes crassus]|uniref:Uncharacterized protein n=1 Tax=Euplotes crassus TaxID=5936 RepID=A0AAD1UHP7_EUPCR|nr:unnamed protein product [Moneuplotes crassus]